MEYVLRTSIDKIKENGFELTKKRSRRYPATTITDADYADDIAILANTPDQAETLLHSLERAAASIGLYVNAHKTEYMCYNQTGDISTLERTPLKLVDKFTYLGSSVESTEKDIETRLTKAWTAINRLSIIWKSDLTDKMKCSFFQAAVTSILLYGCTTWTLTKRLEKKLDGNYTRMLRAILNKSWQQHPTRHQLYGHLPTITKTIQVRQTRHAGHCWRSRDELIRDVLLWTPTHGRAKAGRPARTYIQQLCEDTGCCPEDLPRAMNDREEWQERVRDIRATSAIWWWWWSIDGTPLQLVDKFTYLGSSVASTEKDIDTRLTKAWTAINRLSIIWKSDLTDKMKCSFFQAVVASILLYGCTTWTLTKRLEKKLDGNYTRMLRAILNKSWQQHPTRHQLYGHLPPITKTIQVRRTRHAWHCWRSRDELISDVLLWTPTHGCAKARQPAQTYIQQLCEDTGCCSEDLPEAMNDREKWRERVRDIRATSMTWWWWCHISILWFVRLQ